MLTSSYCNGTEGKSTWLDCVNDPQIVENGFVFDCDRGNTNCDDSADASGFIISDFTCNGIFC